MKESTKNIFKSYTSKILYMISGVDRSDFGKDLRWLKRTFRLYNKILFILPKYPFKHFFVEFGNNIRLWIQDDAKNRLILIEQLKRYFIEGTSQEKEFIHCIFTECRILDNDIMRMIIADLLASDDTSYRYWGSMDVSYSSFGSGQGIYPDFYIDRRKLFNKIANESNITIPTRKPNDGKVKICIITYQLNPDMHNSAQRVCTMFANHLVKFVDELMVLCSDSTYKSNKECRDSITLIRTPRSCREQERINEHFDNNVTIHFVNGDGYIQMAQNFLNMLYDYNPSIIIDLSDDYSPFSYFYDKDFFTVYEPMRVGVSSQYFAKIIATPDKFKTVNERFNHVLDADKALYWVFPEYVPKPISDMSKSDLGISEDSFVIVTIGNNGTIQNALTDAMKEFLEEDPSCVWLLVGYSAPEYLRTRCKALIESKRVVEWGYENNLLGLCAACDIVLRQNTTGGSGGTATAAMKGLPIVMTKKFCDASRWLGMDYSYIENEMGLIEEIKKLKNDAKYYKTRQQLVLNLINSAIDSDDKWRTLYELLIMAEAEWRKRG